MSVDRTLEIALLIRTVSGLIDLVSTKGVDAMQQWAIYMSAQDVGEDEFEALLQRRIQSHLELKEAIQNAQDSISDSTTGV